MKKLTLYLITICFIILSFTYFNHVKALDLKITINGKNVTFTDSKPYANSDSRTMVPIRVISEEMGYNVTWNGTTQEAIIQGEGKTVKIKLYTNTVTVGTQTIVMDTQSVAINGRTYVPIRFVSEALGYNVAYNGATTTVQLTKPDTTTPTIPTPPPVATPTPTTDKIYNLELAKWNIYNDGTHPAETTKGFNNALTWATQNGYNVFKVPQGTYLISKGDGAWYNADSYITLPSNMTFWLDDNAVIQKESNPYTGYKTVVVPMFNHDVVIKGGTFKGDKDTHNYYYGANKWTANKSYKIGDKVIPTNTVSDSSGYYYVATNDGVSGANEPAWTPSKNVTDGTVIWQPKARDTNEGGYGITTYGAYNVTIDGIKATNFTGDGLAIGGDRAYSEGAYANRFEAGAIDSKGNPIVDSTKTRTKDYWSLTHTSFEKTHNFVIDMITGVPQTFDVYFYKADGTFLTITPNQKRGYYVTIPNGAVKFKLVFNGTYNSSIWMEFHNKIQSTNVIVQNSEFSFNRRQGITVGGGNNVLITNNKIHDIKGTMPQAGIDVEGGFWEDGTLNTNITIKNNEFYNNAKYNVVLYDGNTALVEGNKFTDAIGVSIPNPFTNATIKDNDFYHASIYAYHDVNFINNVMTYSYTYLEGPNVNIDGMTFNYSRFFMYPTKPNGIKASNISMKGSVLGFWGQPMEVNNITATEYFAFDANEKPGEGTVVNDLKLDGILYGSLGNVIYNNCSFQNTNGWSNTLALIDKPGKYVFNNCSFGGTKFSGLKINSPEADVMINKTVFDSILDVPAILIEKAKTIDIQNSTIKSNAGIGAQKSVVMIGDDWTNANPSAILNVIFKGNTITANSNANGITTVYSGKNAPSYDIENNTVYNGLFNLKANDINQGNQLLKK